MIDEPLEVDADGGDVPAKRKSMAFYLALLGMNIIIFVYSLDATTLAVAIPVSLSSPQFPCSTFDESHMGHC